MSVSFRSAIIIPSLILASVALMPMAYAQTSTQTFDYQGQTNLGLAPQTPEETQECVEDDGTEATTQSQSTSSTTDPSTILSTTNELDQTKVKCSTLTEAALGTAGYIGEQSETSSVGAAGLLAGAAVLGGGVALLSMAPEGSEPIPFPIPGAGLLSYLVLGGSGLALWIRRRLRAVKDSVEDAVNGQASAKASEPAAAV